METREKSRAAQELGAKGGAVRSDAKTAAARANAALPRKRGLVEVPTLEPLVLLSLIGAVLKNEAARRRLMGEDPLRLSIGGHDVATVIEKTLTRARGKQ